MTGARRRRAGTIQSDWARRLLEPGHVARGYLLRGAAAEPVNFRVELHSRDLRRVRILVESTSGAAVDHPVSRRRAETADDIRLARDVIEQVLNPHQVRAPYAPGAIVLVSLV